MIKRLLVIASVLLAGCQSVEQLRALAPQQPDYEICRGVIAGHPNMRQVAGEEARRRNLDCAPYASAIQQRENASTAVGLQLLQMSQPQPVQMQILPSANCVTRYNGNTAYTTCN